MEAGGDVVLAQRLARTTLAVCLDVGFRLLHPMMPFVTEELWQRLPGRGLPSAAGKADSPSIMIAPYPTAFPALHRPDVEADFAVYQTLVRAGRGLRSDADIVPSKQAGFYIVGGAAVAAAQVADLTTLLRASFVKVVATQVEVEEGCAVAVVSEHASVHLLLRGLVDPTAEIAKLEKKAEKLLGDAEYLRKRMAAPGYADKVPSDVQVKDTDAVAAAEAQVLVLRTLQGQYAGWAAAPPTV